MPRLPYGKIRRLLVDADVASTSQQRGALLESAACLLFESMSGVSVADRNVTNTAGTEEIDIIFWNERRLKGLFFLEAPFLLECKNWGHKVPGHEIVYFANSMRGRCCRDGILIASNGITGTPGQLNEAHYEIAMAARNGQRILVLERNEIEALTSSEGLVALLKKKVLEVTLKGTKLT